MIPYNQNSTKEMIKDIIKSTLRPILTPLRPGNIVMFHIGRCGSTVLSSLLRQHSKIFWASEFYVSIFREWEHANNEKETPGEMPDDAIALLKESMKLALHRYYGFEIKPFHLRLIGYSMESYLQNLDQLGFTHYIHLDRENRLRKIVSSCIAHEDSLKYHQNSTNKARLKQVHINIDKVEIDYDSKPLIKFLSDYDSEVSTLISLLEKRNSLKLIYEKDIQDDPRVGYRKVCEFIGMSPKEVKIDLTRTNPFPVRNLIENFEEVESVLKGTKYKWMLYD